MKVRKVAVLLGFTSLWLFASSADAQYGVGRYQPARPTFSPYLFYGQFNGTGIPNYYTFVRPGQIYQEYIHRNALTPNPGNDRQSLITEQQVSQLIDTQLRQRQTTGVGTNAVPASFQNTSHFFPVPRIQRR